MDGSKLTTLEYGTVGLALALAIDLLALPWVDVSIGPFSYSSAGVGSPDGFLGVLALLLSLAVGADLLLARLAPSFRVAVLETFGRGRARFLAAAGAGALVVLKVLLHLHPSYLGAGCWIAFVLACGLVVSTARLRAPVPSPAPRATGPAPARPRAPDTNA
ncbi:MAG: hypothetical protein M0Z33_08665 [Actinomycetota bacterium]|nr:hypothetical protein [Actinomycetota bacterium]